MIISLSVLFWIILSDLQFLSFLFLDSVGEYGSPFLSGYTQDRNQRYTGTIFSQESTSTNRSHLYNNRIYYPIGSQDTEYTTLELVSTKQNNTISDPKISATNPSYL